MQLFSTFRVKVKDTLRYWNPDSQFRKFRSEIRYVRYFIDTCVQSKIPNELNLIISRSFNNLNLWYVIKVLKVLKEELKIIFGGTGR